MFVDISAFRLGVTCEPYYAAESAMTHLGKEVKGK